jgi:hypothetical protein
MLKRRLLQINLQLLQLHLGAEFSPAAPQLAEQVTQLQLLTNR